MRPNRPAILTAVVALGALLALAAPPAGADPAPPAATPGTPPQGTQSDAAYAASYAAHQVTNVDATGAVVSCYRPEVPFFTSLAPANAYSGMTACPGATTGEDTGAAGPYPTQVGSNPGYPADGPMLVNSHSESDLRVDPTNARHLIGSSKWFVSAEGYNHQLGFYESFDGGATWPVQGHIPGYEGWTDSTDPVGAFDSYGNYYSLLLPYQFIYNPDGTQNFTIGTGKESNPVVATEVVSVAVRPHGSASARDWITTHGGHPDLVAAYDSIGNVLDKQWIAIDTNPASPHFNRVYAMWADFHSATPVPYVSFAQALPDGTHTDWSKPQRMPEPPSTPQGTTYVQPQVTPDGTVYTSLTNVSPSRGYASVSVLRSTDGGVSWTVAGVAADRVVPPPLLYANTTFRDGIETSFAAGTVKVGGRYPLYLVYEDYASGVGVLALTTSTDGGATWSAPVRVNDNQAAVDAFQPNLAAGADGTVAVAFYDRRLACPAAGTAEAAAAGLALDTVNPRYGSLPPYGAANYCVNASVQFYTAGLTPLGRNVRVSGHTWDPQLDAPHTNCPTCLTTFIGDYFGVAFAGGAAYTTSVSTYDDGSDPGHHQQQVVARIPVG